MFYGRSAKARERRAAKIRTKYADFPQMRPDLLEVLALSADVPSKEQVTLYLEAVPTGATPRRVLHGFKLSDVTSYVGVLFDDGLSIRWGSYERVRDKEMKVQGAELPFWGMQKIETFSVDGDDGVLVSGSDGTNEYRIGCLGFDPQDVQAFAEATEAARQAYAQRAQRAPAQAAQAPAQGVQAEAQQAPARSHASAGSAQMTVNIDSTLPPGQQLAALEQMRALGAVPDDVYQTTAARIRGAGG